MNELLEQALREELLGLSDRMSAVTQEGWDERFDAEFESTFPNLLKLRLEADDVSEPRDPEAAIRRLLEEVRNPSPAEGSSGQASGSRRLWWAGIGIAACLGFLIWLGVGRRPDGPLAHRSPPSRQTESPPVRRATPKRPSDERIVHRSTPGGRVVRRPSHPSGPIHNLPGRAAETVARLGGIAGNATVVSGSRELPATAGYALAAGSVVQTGDFDRTEVILNDGTRFVLDFDTRLELPRSNRGPQTVRLLQGSLFAAVTPRGPDRLLSVKCPTATATALGTEFILEIRRPPARLRPALTALSVLHGRVRFFNDHGSIVAGPMTASTAALGATPEEPKAIASIRSIHLAGFISARGSVVSDALVQRPQPLGADEFQEDLVSSGRHRAPMPAVDPVVMRQVEPFTSDLLAGRSEAAQEGLRDLYERIPLAPVANNLGVALESTLALARAGRMYARAVSLAPDVALYRYNLARVLSAVGNNERAIEELEAGRRLAPEWPAILNDLAIGYLVAGRTDEARSIAAKLAKATNDAQTLGSSAEILLSSAADAPPDSKLYADLLETSERLFRRALELRPTEYNVLINFAALLVQAGRPIEAEPLLRTAVKVKPREADGWTSLGLVLWRTDRTEEAEAAFKEGLRVSPGDPLALSNLGSMLIELGRVDEAIPYLLSATRADPLDGDSLVSLADCYRTLKQYAKAESYALQALRIEPNSPWFTYRLGRIYEAWGHLDASAEIYRRIVAHNPRYRDAWVHLGQVRYFQSRWADSEAAYRKVIELPPNKWDSHYNLADVLVHEAKVEQAIPEYRKSIELDPKQTLPRVDLALLLVNQAGQLGEAHRLLDEALAINPKDPSANLALGIVLSKDGKLDLAEAAFKNAINLFGGDKAGASDSWGKLGRLYEAKGDTASALAAYRTALKLDSSNKEAAAALKRLGG